jgi:hypothetical protein
VVKRRGAEAGKPAKRSDGTRLIFWLNLLVVLVLIVLLALGQWDFLLAGVIAFLLLNGVFARGR